MNTTDFENEFWTDRGVYDDVDADCAAGDWPSSPERPMTRAGLYAAGIPDAEIDGLLRVANHFITRPENAGVEMMWWHGSIKPDADMPAIEMSMADGKTRWAFMDCDRRRPAGDAWRVVGTSS